MSEIFPTSAIVRTERLNKTRVWMSEQGVDAVIIPSADPHMSEYLPAHWQGRAWLSGFTGSAGTLVLTKDEASLWTDSRYWTQASIELDGTGIELKKLTSSVPSYFEYLADVLPVGASVAIDGMVLSMSQYDELCRHVSKKNITITIDIDILQAIWVDRPSLPTTTIYMHDSRFVDVSTTDKLGRVRDAMHDQGVEYHLISSLDDIAWLTNLRGADVAYNPVFLAHLLICSDGAILYVDEAKLNDEIKMYLCDVGIDIKDYQAIGLDVAELDGKLLVDPAKVVMGIVRQKDVVKATNPSTLLKAIKTPMELNHIREAMRQDGAALCEFFARLEYGLEQGEYITELDIATMLDDVRATQPHYVSASFDTIAGFGANGAIVHYRATPTRHSAILGDGLLLIDSGAQYLNGTTDITRMVGVGRVSDTQKQDVTYVLKAHIALAMAYYPAGLSSVQIDILARNQLWRHGLDYGHGTGHGVGYFMNVHEGPQTISYSAPMSPERVLLCGMVTSNEPGLYRTDQWGIRLENLVVTVSAEKTDFGQFLKFETLTLCPFDTRLILPELLTSDEVVWLNNYHNKVRGELIERVYGDAKAWLIARTEPI